VAASRRLAVRFDESIWNDALRGFSAVNQRVAVTARSRLEAAGVALADLLPCEANGGDGTELAGCAKLYLPLRDAPPSQRPFAFVLRLRREGEELVWSFVAFGPRHPRPGVRSVYERAHRQLHGRFPRRA
jgi:hypothetical protein